MSAENKELVARRIGEELFNEGDLSVADELIAPNAVDHNEPPGTDCREHFKRVATMLRSAFPDLHMHIEDMIADEEKIEVSNEAVIPGFEAFALGCKQPFGKWRGFWPRDGAELSIAHRLRNRKALDLLVENAKVAEEEWSDETEKTEVRSQNSE